MALLICMITNKLTITEEWLREQYLDKQISASQIARDQGCTRSAITYWLKKWGIPMRSIQQASYLANFGDKNPSRRPEVIEKLSGENNHFFGKHHTEETKQKLSAISSRQENLDRLKEVRNSDAYKKTMIENNPMNCPEIREKHLKIMRETRSGENCNLWKGGISKINNAVRQTHEYSQWRLNVYKRDKFTCVLCGSTSRDINADHIIPFSAIMKSNNIKTVEEARSCLSLWDLNNGRTLCVPCHKETDTYLYKSTQRYRKQII